MPHPIIDLLLARRSVSANALSEPGPSQAEIQLILKAASRVPDHKKLVPWRFILFQGEAAAELAAAFGCHAVDPKGEPDAVAEHEIDGAALQRLLRVLGGVEGGKRDIGEEERCFERAPMPLTPSRLVRVGDEKAGDSQMPYAPAFAPRILGTS